MKKFGENEVVYNGANFCSSGCCPVVRYDRKAGEVTISDPAKRQNGSFRMTVEEYNTLLKNAKPIET